MTVGGAISRVDSLKPNTFTQEEKLAWLSEIDGRIVKEILATHEHTTLPDPSYTTSDLTDDLIAPSPYDALYLAWLESQIDYYDGETTRFDNSSAVFNAKYSDYERWYNREHKPISTKIRYF